MSHESKTIIFTCPHCKHIGVVVEKEINCAIFRHGVYIKTMKQIDPHAPKKLCDELAMKNLIHGCGKPFRLIKASGAWVAEVCDYI